MEGFKDLIGRYLKTRKDIYVNWDKIKPPPEDMVSTLRDFASINKIFA